MMACGKPVIATNYSAHTEYCNPANTLLIEGSRLEPAHPDEPSKQGLGNWLAWDDAQTQQLCHHMKVIYERYRSTDKLFNAAGYETANRLTWDVTAEKLLQVARN
jgi:glycosyltransferase involved in cell wall biosynthesis